MKTGGKIVAFLQRLDEHVLPFLANHAAPVGNANDKCLRTCRQAFFERHIGEPHIGAAPRQPELTHRIFWTPIGDALRHFCRKLIRRIAEEEKIWSLDHGTPLFLRG